MSKTYLDSILIWHRERAKADNRSAAELASACELLEPTRDFAQALRADGLSVIAEVKRRSPSKGELGADLDPAAVAKEYADGGAACLSVLTDEKYFGGSRRDLEEARSVVTIPVLRKDFTVCANDIYDARLMGADAVLLIAAALSDSELSEYYELATSLGLASLFEIHDETELERVNSVGAEIIGVNQRDLMTFEVDQKRAVDLAPLIDRNCIRVGESGIRGREDASVLAQAGFDAILVGESVVMAGSRSDAVRALASV